MCYAEKKLGFETDAGTIHQHVRFDGTVAQHAMVKMAHALTIARAI
jgi:hypothetical protein